MPDWAYGFKSRPRYQHFLRNIDSGQPPAGHFPTIFILFLQSAFTSISLIDNSYLIVDPLIVMSNGLSDFVKMNLAFYQMAWNDLT